MRIHSTCIHMCHMYMQHAMNSCCKPSGPDSLVNCRPRTPMHGWKASTRKGLKRRPRPSSPCTAYGTHLLRSRVSKNTGCELCMDLYDSQKLENCMAHPSMSSSLIPPKMYSGLCSRRTRTQSDIFMIGQSRTSWCGLGLRSRIVTGTQVRGTGY